MKKQRPLPFSSLTASSISRAGRSARRSLVCFIVLGGLLSGAAQRSPGQPVVITVKDAVSQTLKNNYDLAQARMEVERADAMVTEAWGSALPKLDLSASYSRAIKKPVFFLPGDFFGQPGTVKPVEIGSTNAFSALFTANQVLFNSAVFVGLGAAKIYSRGAREGYRARVVEYVARARKAYYGVLVSKQILDLARQTMKNSEDNLRNVRLLAAQGLVSEYDQLRAEVTLENIKPELINAENGYEIALNALKAVMAIPYDTVIEVQGEMEYHPVSDSLTAAAQEMVLAHNPSLVFLKTQAEVNDAIVSAQKSEYLHILSAFGNYQYQGQSNEFRNLTQDVIASSQVGLSLSLNIFNGLQTTARVQQAQVDYKKSLEQVNGATQNLQTSTESVLLQLNKARRKIEAQGKTVEQADRGYRIATTRYNSGLGTLLDVNDAQLALIRANVNRIEAVYEYTAAAVDLDQLLGRLPDYVTLEEDEE